MVLSEKNRQDPWHDWKGKFVVDGCLHCLVRWYCLFHCEKAALFESHPVPSYARKKVPQTNMRTKTKFLKMRQPSPLSKDEFWEGL